MLTVNSDSNSTCLRPQTKIELAKEKINPESIGIELDGWFIRVKGHVTSSS